MLYNKVSILQNSLIKNNCIIQPNIVIGGNGFAFERDQFILEIEKFPHFGNVGIKEDMEIYANCFVARGSLSHSIIKKGTKLDSLDHVAHNAQTEKNCQITAESIVSGNVKMGDDCCLGLKYTLKQKIIVGNKVIVGSSAVVIDNLEGELKVAGLPKKSIKQKVTTDKLSLMARQSIHNSDNLKEPVLAY